jgi:hypothetical protein
VDNPVTLTTADELGRLAWFGYNGAWSNTKAAEIYVGVDAIALNSTSGRILFATTPSGGTTPVDRMTIKGDGTVNIAGLFGGTAAVSGDKAVYVTSGGDLVVGAAMTKSFSNENKQLKEEIKSLKAEMVELRKMVEGLMTE